VREALNHVRQGAELLAIESHVGLSGFQYIELGRACLTLGRLDEAQRFGERGVKLLSSLLGGRAHALQLLGYIATHPERFDAERGETHYHQALALAEPRGMRPLIAHCHLGLSKLYQRIGRREQASEHLGIATTMYREMDMHFWREQAEAGTRELA
jgi:tetratricopeptide (TPR) repeat protein